jgi:hypothetical protein
LLADNLKRIRVLEAETQPNFFVLAAPPEFIGAWGQLCFAV